jgi:hypothetical protein
VRGCAITQRGHVVSRRQWATEGAALDRTSQSGRLGPFQHGPPAEYARRLGLRIFGPVEIGISVSLDDGMMGHEC